MKLEWRRVPRNLGSPRWAVAVVVLWLALIGVAVLLQHASGEHHSLCVFRQVTGVPCPTCGSGRSVIAMSHGQFGDALGYNPLIFIILCVGTALIMMRLAFGRGVRLTLTSGSRVAMWIVIALAACANWAYVICRDT